MTRKLARDLTFKILYQADVQKEDYTTIFNLSAEENNIDEKSRDYILNTINGIEKNSENINSIIADKSEGWKINRISKISLACLKLGIYEVLYNNEVPDTVAVNEAVSIAKLYEGDESAKFVNGILSTVLKEKA